MQCVLVFCDHVLPLQGGKANLKLRKSVLATLLHCRHTHMLHLPLVSSLFNIKWRRFACTMLLRDCAWHVLAAGVQVCASS